jgi:hypothetical protein
MGSLAAGAVLEADHRDGATSSATSPGGSGVPYANDTGYAAESRRMDLRAAIDRAAVRDPSA